MIGLPTQPCLVPELQGKKLVSLSSALSYDINFAYMNFIIIKQFPLLYF
jgi:hypothetical protein